MAYDSMSVNVAVCTCNHFIQASSLTPTTFPWWLGLKIVFASGRGAELYFLPSLLPLAFTAFEGDIDDRHLRLLVLDTYLRRTQSECDSLLN